MNSHFSYLVTQEHSAHLRRQAAHAALVAEARKPRRLRIHLKIPRGWLRARRPATAAR